MIKRWLLLGSVAFGVGFGVSLSFQRDVKQAAFNGLAAVPASAVVLTLVARQKHQSLSYELVHLETKIYELEQQKQALVIGIQADELMLGKVQQEVVTQQVELTDLQASIKSYQAQQNIEAAQLTDLQTQRVQNSQSLSKLEADLQVAEVLLRQTHQNLEVVSLDRQAQEIALVELQAKWEQQKQRQTELDATIVEQENFRYQLITIIQQMKAEQQYLEKSVNNQNDQEKLPSRSVKENSGQYRTTKKLINSDFPKHDQSTSSPNEFSSPLIDEPVSPVQLLEDSAELSDTSILILELRPMQLDFTNPEATEQFWRKTLLPYWSHHDRPVGQRFMGSFRISAQSTQNLLGLVRYNLKRIGDLTEKRLSNRFGDAAGGWGKIVTLALSEYAYHYSESNNRFWDGFCQHIQINNSQLAEKALRATVDQGFDSLGLIRAKGGYRYVSTLWLQSGVPKQNLEHFSQLV